MCLGDGLDLGNNITLGELEGSNPGGVQAPTHMAYFMSTTLKRKNPARNKTVHNVISCGLLFLLEHLNVLDNPVYFCMLFLGIIQPVLPRRIAGNINREVDQILLASILHIKQGPLPLPARF
jgi:hypothetical protein